MKNHKSQPIVRYYGHRVETSKPLHLELYECIVFKKCAVVVADFATVIVDINNQNTTFTVFCQPNGRILTWTIC